VLCISVLLVTFLITVKRALNKRNADFKHFYHIKQLTSEEFEDLRDETTKAELEKLHASKEFN
jgi:hypothetical protein